MPEIFDSPNQDISGYILMSDLNVIWKMMYKFQIHQPDQIMPDTKSCLKDL